VYIQDPVSQLGKGGWGQVGASSGPLRTVDHENCVD
jgi:hypothetical protein